MIKQSVLEYLINLGVDVSKELKVRTDSNETLEEFQGNGVRKETPLH